MNITNPYETKVLVIVDNDDLFPTPGKEHERETWKECWYRPRLTGAAEMESKSLSIKASLDSSSIRFRLIRRSSARLSTSSSLCPTRNLVCLFCFADPRVMLFLRLSVATFRLKNLKLFRSHRGNTVDAGSVAAFAKTSFRLFAADS